VSPARVVVRHDDYRPHPDGAGRRPWGTEVGCCAHDGTADLSSVSLTFTAVQRAGTPR
jgi:hypothetical protein